MSGGRSGKNWTAGTLKSRGWTEPLVKELLPKPVYRHFNGRSVRTWNKETVLEAEKTERFTAAAEAVKKQRTEDQEREKAEYDALLEASLRLLEEAWQLPEDAETEAALLAGHYHRGILSMMKGGAQRSLR